MELGDINFNTRSPTSIVVVAVVLLMSVIMSVIVIGEGIVFIVGLI